MSVAKPKITYNQAEAAEAVGVSERTIRDAIKAGTLPAYYPTTRPLIKAEDLKAWATTDRKAS